MEPIIRAMAAGVCLPLALFASACNEDLTAPLGWDPSLAALQDGGIDDACENATAVTLPFEGPVDIAPFGDHDWYTFELTHDRVVVLETVSPTADGFDDDTNITVWRGDCGAREFVGFAEDRDGAEYTSFLETGLHSGTYFVDVGGWNDISLAAVTFRIEDFRDPNPPPPSCSAEVLASACSGGSCDCTCSHRECACPATYGDDADFAARVPDPDDVGARWCASIATLDAVQEAIDSARPHTTITLEQGLHDHSAVVYPLDDFPAENEFYAYNMDTRHCHGDGDPALCFGTHRLQGKRGNHIPAHGVVVLGAHDLTLAGEGTTRTHVLGNPHPKAARQDFSDAAAWYNVGFTLGGGSKRVTIEDIHFDEFWLSVLGMSWFTHASLPGNVSDPDYDGGTIDARVVHNRFTPTQWSVIFAGGHTSPRIEYNEFDQRGSLPGTAIGGLFGGPGPYPGAPPELLAEAQVIGNDLLFADDDHASSGVVPIGNYTVGGRIAGNYQRNGAIMIELVGNAGYTIEDNVADGPALGLVAYPITTAFLDASGSFHQVAQNPDDNTIVGNDFDALFVGILIDGGSHNTIEHNDIRSGAVGIELESAGVWEFDGEWQFNVQPSTGNQVGDVDISGDMAVGISLVDSSRGRFHDVDIDGAGVGVSLVASSDNSFRRVDVDGAATCVAEDVDSSHNTFRDLECDD